MGEKDAWRAFGPRAEVPGGSKKAMNDETRRVFETRRVLLTTAVYAIRGQNALIVARRRYRTFHLVIFY